jgi:Transglycosylase SLT domain/D-alanyl-D-alanine carboxypeptidase
MGQAGEGMTPPLVLATDAGGAGGGLAEAAAMAVAVAVSDRSAGVLMVEVTDEGRRRRPTLLASDAARDLQAALGASGLGRLAVARGNLCWLTLGVDDDPLEALEELVREALPCLLVVAHLPAALWARALERPGLAVAGGLVRADLDADRELAALAVAELRARGMTARVAKRAPGVVATRRAVAGLDPGSDASRRAGRAAQALLGALPSATPAADSTQSIAGPTLASERGQALPLVLGASIAVIFTALLLAALGGAITGKGRAQRAADLTALSAVRSMRDDLDRLLAPPRLANGAPNPTHLTKGEYLARATAAARKAAAANGVDPRRVRVRFPDMDSFAPVQARARVLGELERERIPGPERDRSGRPARRGEPIDVVASATAEASAPASFDGMPTMASGGGYSGPLVYRQGEGMRPDVAAAFDRMAAAARRAGISLVVNSGFRSDAEQAELFAANPNPTMVAPPGKSLHRCATELDLGPPSAYGWLAANAPRFGFVKRYSWEPWHFGFTRGPAPCSEAGNSLAGGDSADGRGAGGSGVPSFVPERYRAMVLRSAARWNVSAPLLAAQLMAESGFDPNAVSPVGAQGIAQFMPGTAASYGLDDPFDPAAAIDAQAHMMSDLLRQFGSIPLALAAYNAGPGAVSACDCIPPYPETQAYVARILALLDGAGALLVPPLEVRLVE